ncbi:unnamed protein product [Rhizoctonia solani]|uniref:O-methylsterigmatocystin oxidoreductase n=1 Tax=Rhizoctonia solani TaxID=456999 RepID=A0A8H3E5A3_9AGAM|nr:unnamed protein product [Rhizoctonia solani]
MKKDKNAPLIVGSLRNQALKLGLTEEEADKDVKQVSITLYGAGTETAVHTLLMFFLAMILYPEAQTKAQEEIDSVIGNGRLPTFEDQGRLRYVERLIQETLRWVPVVPLAIPHTCFRDDTYKGYYIPKGTIVMGNVWAMTRDETIYKSPEVFNPDRFLDPSTPPAPTFGWGRRRCPGVHFADASLFIFITSILATFKIGVAQDENGKDIMPSRKMSNSLVLWKTITSGEIYRESVAINIHITPALHWTMPDTPLLIGLTLASSLLAYKLYKDTHENQLSLPPSPRSYPLIGHLLSIPTEFEHLGFMRLGEQLKSKIFSLTAFGTTIIVLNDRDDAVNLFDKRSGSYSDRTNSTMVQEPSLLNWPEFGSLIAYGDRWRRFRRLMNPLLTKQVSATHQQLQEQAATKLLQRLLKGHKDIHNSHEVETELVLCIAATMFRSLYGYEVASSNDPLAERTQKAVSYLAHAVLSSNYLVNVAPVLRTKPDLLT